MASLPGDVNSDDAVNVADLSVFALNFQMVPGRGYWELGDFSTDEHVSTAILSLLVFNFGVDVNSGDEALAGIAGIDVVVVPEPGIWALIGSMVVVGVFRRITYQRS